MDQERRNWTIWRTLKIKIDRRTILGSYCHGRWDKLVEVKTDKGRTIAQLGDSSPQELAQAIAARAGQ